ncbi:unnamed protein product, partial [Staurois parvus]
MDTGVYNHPLAMQTASTNIGERMGRSQELSDSKRGPVIGGPLHFCQITCHITQTVAMTNV